MDIEKRIEQAENPEALAQALTTVRSEEELLDVLKAHGITATAEEIRELLASGEPEGELDDDALEDVAGGVTVLPKGKYIAKALKKVLKYLWC